MTDREALYRAILDDPDNDTLRLIYADSLEEESDARRAAFVRAQVTLARQPDYEPESIRLRFSEVSRADPDWLNEFPLPDGIEWSREPFRRGLPAAIVATDATTFLSHAKELLTRFPIESLDLGVARLGEASDFADSRWIARLVRLSLLQGMGGSSAWRLLHSHHYLRLRELQIGAALTTEESATVIVRTPIFKQLTALSCRADRGGGMLVSQLTRLADPPQLLTLNLSGIRLNPAPLSQLLAAPALAGIQELDLSDNNLGASTVEAMARAPLPRMRSLKLQRTRPEEAGIEALATAPFLRGLRSLQLGGNHLAAPAALAIADTPNATQMRVLDFRENRLGDRGAIALAQSPHLRSLVHLDLANNLIEDDGAMALAESAALTGLICLDLGGNLITPAIARRLREHWGERVLL